MNIGIDIDDTITDTFDFLIPYVAEYFSLDVNYLKENNISYNNLPIEYKHREKDFGLSVFGKILLDVPVKKDAVKFINKLRDKGNRIIIITARDKSIFTDPDGITRRQIEKLGINYDKIICTFDKKQACLDENINILIDDSINTLESVKDVVEDICLFNSKSNINKNVPIKRFDNWEKLYTYISSKE